MSSIKAIDASVLEGRLEGEGEKRLAMASYLKVLASGLIAMAASPIVMASYLVMMASKSRPSSHISQKRSY